MAGTPYGIQHKKGKKCYYVALKALKRSDGSLGDREKRIPLVQTVDVNQDSHGRNVVAVVDRQADRLCII